MNMKSKILALNLCFVLLGFDLMPNSAQATEDDFRHSKCNLNMYFSYPNEHIRYSNRNNEESLMKNLYDKSYNPWATGYHNLNLLIKLREISEMQIEANLSLVGPKFDGIGLGSFNTNVKAENEDALFVAIASKLPDCKEIYSKSSPLLDPARDEFGPAPAVNSKAMTYLAACGVTLQEAPVFLPFCFFMGSSQVSKNELLENLAQQHLQLKKYCSTGEIDSSIYEQTLKFQRLINNKNFEKVSRPEVNEMINFYLRSVSSPLDSGSRSFVDNTLICPAFLLH